MKRLVSSYIVAVVLCLGMSKAFADVHYIVVASDRHATSDAISNSMKGIKNTIEQENGEIGYVCLDGDMVDNTDAFNSSTVLSEVKNVFGNTKVAHNNVSIIYGSHDFNCTDDSLIMKCNDGDDPNNTGKSALIYTGKTKGGKDAYYVYGVSYASMFNNLNTNNLTAATEASNFKQWVATTDPSIPIIVICHVPMHYARKDNLGATYWNEALNYAATGEENVTDNDKPIIRNVIFLHGHNHTTERSSSSPYTTNSILNEKILAGPSGKTSYYYEYYIPAHSTMTIQGTDGTTVETPIYYTYTTAGYLKHRKAATLIKIDGQDITVIKYVGNSNVFTNTATAYANSSYKNNFTSTFVTGSPNTISRSMIPDLTMEDKDDGTISNNTSIANCDHTIYDVTINGRTISMENFQWNTLCLPFDVDLSDPHCPLHGARVKKLVSSVLSEDGGTLTLNFEDATVSQNNQRGYMYAGKPYIVRWEGDEKNNIVNPTFYGVTVSNVEPEASITEHIDFKGCFSPIILPKDDRNKLFIGSRNKLYYPSADVRLNPFRGYFELHINSGDPTTESKQLNSFYLNFDGNETTGVIEIVNDEKAETGWYTLDGRKLMERPAQKGIYIMNGKKVVIQ